MHRPRGGRRWLLWRLDVIGDLAVHDRYVYWLNDRRNWMAQLFSVRKPP